MQIERLKMEVVNRYKVRTQEPNERIKNFEEVSLGFDEETATLEAQRCINCKNPQCVQGCPVNINIPGFIAKLKQGDKDGALEIINHSSLLPAICGRVCP